MPLESFDEVIAYLNRKNRIRHILLGNGFSMAYDADIFSYNALQDFVANIQDPILNKLFEIVRTKNFEVVMHQLTNFVELLNAFDGDKGLIAQVNHASKSLQAALLDAVRTMHPEHVFTLHEDHIAACRIFLSRILDSGGQIFSANYDLLLYWVLMRSDVENHVDGFGHERLDDPSDMSTDEEWSDLIWGPNVNKQNIHYLHGALPLFDGGTETIKETFDSTGTLLENISSRMERDEYPIFVAAGDGEQKLRQIRHNPYLAHCYDELSNIQGSLITFGFNFGESDEHIIEAINRATTPDRDAPLNEKLWSVYIGVYSDQDRQHIESIRSKFRCKVKLFDSSTVSPWG